jgi:dipeptidase D
MGGHSGVEIDKGRANSNVLLGRALYEISGCTAFNLKSVSGGLKDNAIPRMSEAILVTDRTSINKIKDICEDLTAKLHVEYSLTDPEILISIEETPSSEALPTAMTTESGRRVITALYNMPAGIQNMSFSLPGLVETSLNMGILFTEADKVVMSYSVRSSVGSRKDELVNRLRCLAEALGGNVTTEGAYPAWEYLENSPLREAMISVYEDMYKEKPVIESIHAGVECGLFADGLPGLDAVSFGPDIHDIHTPKEALDIESVKRTWEYLLKVLEVI